MIAKIKELYTKYKMWANILIAGVVVTVVYLVAKRK